MTAIAIMSIKHSPGATTLALALATAAPERDPLVVEVDPAGGDLAARFGLPTDPGLVTLAANARRGLDSSLIDASVQQLPAGVPALLAPPASSKTRAALDHVGEALASWAAKSDRLVIFDAGRREPGLATDSILAESAVVLIVTRPTVDGVATVCADLPLSPRVADRTIVVCVGERPYRADEVGAVLHPTPVAVVELDRSGAGLVGSAVNAWGARRMLLVRSARALLDSVVPIEHEVPVA